MAVPLTSAADADYTATGADHVVEYTTVTGARTLNLPALASIPVDWELTVIEATMTNSGYFAGVYSRSIRVTPAGTELLNGVNAPMIIPCSTAGSRTTFRKISNTGGWASFATPASNITGVENVDYTCKITDRFIYYGSMTASRTVTLPDRTLFPSGETLAINGGGFITNTRNLTVVCVGADFIEGVATFVMGGSVGTLVLRNAATKWAIVSVGILAPAANMVDLRQTKSASTSRAVFGNKSNVATTEHGEVQVVSGGASGGDAIFHANVTGVTDWVHGADNSVTAHSGGGADVDPWVLARATSLGTSSDRVKQWQSATEMTAGPAYTPREIGDANVTIVNTDAEISFTTAFTAARTATLPALSSVPKGKRIVVRDAVGGVTVVNTMIVSRAGADTFTDGTNTKTLSTAYGKIEVSAQTAGWFLESTMGTVV